MQISDQRGFALFALLLNAAVIATLVSLWGLELRLQNKREREQMLLDTGRELRQAISSYHKRNIPLSPNTYPDTIESLLQDHRGSYTVRHLRSLPIDPITHKPMWGTVIVGGKIACFYSLSTEAPIQKMFLADLYIFSNSTKYKDWKFCHPQDLQTTLKSINIPN